MESVGLNSVIFSFTFFVNIFILGLSSFVKKNVAHSQCCRVVNRKCCHCSCCGLLGILKLSSLVSWLKSMQVLLKLLSKNLERKLRTLNLLGTISSHKLWAFWTECHDFLCLLEALLLLRGKWIEKRFWFCLSDYGNKQSPVKVYSMSCQETMFSK